MNASVVVFLFVAAVVALASGFPAAEKFKVGELQIRTREEVDDSEILDPQELVQEEETVVRARRATCDLLSFSTSFGSLNHSACAAHCLALRKGFRGGRCKDGVCRCRK